MQTLDLFGMLIKSVRNARIQVPDTRLSESYRLQLMNYQQMCVQMKLHGHKKTAALATEMLNDWEAIFRILDYPHYPLTNNETERALRHWVILRSICYGTRIVVAKENSPFVGLLGCDHHVSAVR